MKEYALVVVPLSEEDGGGFLAYYPDLPGCLSDGETPEEAVENAADALSAWMEVQLDCGAEIPEPGAAVSVAREREKKLLFAVKALAEYSEEAENHIARLEEVIELLGRQAKDNWAASLPLVTYEGRNRRLACH